MSDTLGSADCTPTICVTGTNLDEHPGVSADLVGIDLAVHGYRHLRYSALTLEEQAKDLDRACSSFRSRGFRVTGFRAPYLQMNPATLGLLRNRGFLFDSSLPCIAIPRDAAAGSIIRCLARKRYGHVEGNRQQPHVLSGLVEIPVGLPDDEMLVDALGIRNPNLILRLFASMLKRAAERNSALVLQIHPERFSYCAEAIREVLILATDLGGWKTTLSGLANWVNANPGFQNCWPNGHSFALAITGDLDALTITDFGRRLWAAFG